MQNIQYRKIYLARLGNMKVAVLKEKTRLFRDGSLITDD